MNITLKTLKFTETPELRTFVLEKTAKLFHQNPELIRVDVTLKLGAVNNPSNKWCEIYVSIAGENKFTKRNSESFEESTLKAIEVMERLLKKNK